MKKANAFKVLIPDGESRIALSVLRCLGNGSKFSAVVMCNQEQHTIRRSKYCSKFVFIGNLSDDERLEKTLECAKSEQVDIILPIDVQLIRLLAEHKQGVEAVAPVLPLPNVATFDMVNDKWTFANWLHDNKIPHPRTFQCKNDGDVVAFSESLRYPVINKPKGGSGGKGISIFKTKEELVDGYKDIDCPEDYICQNFINGYDIDCSVLSENGKMIASTVQKSFVLKAQQGVGWPAGVEFVHEDRLQKIVDEMVRKLKWTGVMHIDLRYDADLDEFKVIEINPRFWASVEASMFAGVNFPSIVCSMLLQKEAPAVNVSYKRIARSEAAIKMFAKRMLRKKDQDYHFDHTYLEVIVKDPIPYVYTYWNKFKRAN